MCCHEKLWEIFVGGKITLEEYDRLLWLLPPCTKNHAAELEEEYDQVFVEWEQQEY